MENLLSLDLNELVSQRVSERIEELEQDLSNANSRVNSKNAEITALKKQVDAANVSIEFITYLRSAYAKVTDSPKEENDWHNRKNKNQFLFIEQIMKVVFGIDKERNGWLSNRGDGNLITYLAINYYNHKEVLITLLKCIVPEWNDEHIIRNFKMPFDYGKNLVLNYVKSPQYNTNSSIFGISNFWVEAGGGLTNMPHDLIMKNDFILEEDVFSELIASIQKKSSNFYYLFALPKYNLHISDEHILRMGNCLPSLTDSQLHLEDVREFVSKNINKFSGHTISFLYSKATSESFKLLNWQNFPVEWQNKYLMGKTIAEILKIFNQYDCKWTVEEKDSFLKQYYLGKTLAT